MFTVNISTQKLTDTEKILALGEPENLAKMDFVLVDAAGQPVNAENCQFDLMMGEVNCPRYKTDANTVSFRYIALDITKAQTEFALTLKKDGVTICNDSIKVTAEVQGDIVLPAVTVTADTMLKDVTAINTAGEVVTGNISDAVITTAQTNGLTVNVSKGYVAADETRAFDPSVVTETDTQITISRGWLNEDKAFQGGGSSEVQGILYNNVPTKTTKVQIIPSNLTAGWTDFSKMFYGCNKLTSIPQLDTSSGTDFSKMFNGCSSLTSIPTLNTSKGTNFSEMFYNCPSLISAPVLDTSKGTNFSGMFYSSSKITTIPAFDTSNGTNFSNMFYGCSGLTSIPTLNTSKSTNFNYMFAYCRVLTTIEGIDFSGATSSISSGIFSSCSALTSVKVNGIIPVAIDISQAPKLDLTSLNSFCDALQTKTSGVYYLTLTQTQYDQLSSSTINAVKNKGWGFKIA